MNETEIKLNVFRLVDGLQSKQLHEVYEKLLFGIRNNIVFFLGKNGLLFCNVFPPQFKKNIAKNGQKPYRVKMQNWIGK